MQIVELLGGEKVLRAEVKSDMVPYLQIRKGLPVASVKELGCNARLTAAELERIVSRRTLARLGAQKKRRHSPKVSERLARYAHVLELADRMFQNADRQPNPELDGAIPFDMLGTEHGGWLIKSAVIRKSVEPGPPG